MSIMTANRIVALQPWLLVFIGLLVYANSLGNPFVFDDHSSIINNTDIRQLWPPHWALRTLGQMVEAAEQFRITLKLQPTFNQARRALDEITRKR